MVPVFLYSFYLTLYKLDIPLRRTLKAGSKGVRLNCWPTTPNIVGCYMLRPFADPVARCCVLLRKVWNRSNVKLRANGRYNSQHCWPVGSCWVHFHSFREKRQQLITQPHTQIISRSFQNLLTSLLQLCFSIDLSVSGKLKHPLQKPKRPPWKPKLRLLTYSKQKEESCLFLLQDV